MARIFTRLERFYDAVPRLAAVAEEVGAFTLYVREGAGYPFYARPRTDGEKPSAADVTAVRARQRDLGVPEAFEWVHETHPDLLAVARSAGLDVLLAPLLTLQPGAFSPASAPGVRLLDPTGPAIQAELQAGNAVSRLAFGDLSTSTGTTPRTALAGALVAAPAGPAERDAVPAPPPGVVEALAQQHATGSMISAVASTEEEGILSVGSVQRADGAAEIVGVATLPSARRRGLASAVTSALAAAALEAGDDPILLSAGDEDIARLYTRLGFRRVGTACIATPSIAPPALT